MKKRSRFVLPRREGDHLDYAMIRLRPFLSNKDR